MTDKALVLLVCIAALTQGVSAVHAAGVESHGYPRIMGMNIARPAFYDTPEFQKALAKLDIVILGFWEGWGRSKKGITERDVLRQLKKQNPGILIGQYTILSEWKDLKDPSNARPELSRKLDSENWWLRDGKRNRVQWTDQYHAWDINITSWAKPDHNGDRYPQWLAQKDYRTFFEPIPEFDIWYFDNALSRPAVKKADWDSDGKEDSRDDPRIATAYRRGHAAHWDAARKLHPTALFVGNSDDVSSPEYSGKLQGVFMEAVIGATWSMERWKGWDAVMERYRAALKHTAPPHIVGFNVHGKKDDYQRMRYGLATCLMDDGYFSYTDENAGYGSVVWFDEYNVGLGEPIDPPPFQPWKDGVYRRRFRNGMVLVNPGFFSRTVEIEDGYRRIAGSQDPTINDGAPVRSVSLKGKDGILLIKRTN